jgi:cob(I)alamin adenosyltransferase
MADVVSRSAQKNWAKPHLATRAGERLMIDVTDADARRHREKMEKRKAAQDAEVASKTITEKGLLIVHTGAGKGKSTAAFGLLVRALGHGFPCGVVQFIKGGWETGERRALERFSDLLTWHTMGEGFTWETQDRARDIRAAEAAWAKAQELMARPGLKLLVLDELNIVLRYDYLPLADVVAALASRRPDLHVVVTGRNAKQELIDAADLVTEMSLIKHHFAAGVKAQAGIEF